MASKALIRKMLKQLYDSSKYTSQEELAKAAGVSPKTVWNAMQGNPVAKKSRIAIGRALGLAGDFLLFVAQKAEDTVTASKEPPAGVPSAEINSGLAKGERTQDIKLVLKDQPLRKQILDGKALPSFAACVDTAVAFTPVNDKHKDYPFLPATRYNHFFQPSVVVVLRHRGGQRILGYSRMPKDGSPDYLHTQGYSILLTSDFLRRLHRHKQSPMDRWMACVRRNKAEAAEQFLDGEKPVLLEIIQYKADLSALACKIEPFGVITNDQRIRGTGRVYTQYVFRITCPVSDSDLDELVRRISAPGLALHLVPEDAEPDEFFVGREGRKNVMDIAVWRALRGEDLRIKVEKATFIRGFDLV